MAQSVGDREARHREGFLSPPQTKLEIICIFDLPFFPFLLLHPNTQSTLLDASPSQSVSTRLLSSWSAFPTHPRDSQFQSTPPLQSPSPLSPLLLFPFWSLCCCPLDHCNFELTTTTNAVSPSDLVVCLTPGSTLAALLLSIIRFRPWRGLQKIHHNILPHHTSSTFIISLQLFSLHPSVQQTPSAHSSPSSASSSFLHLRLDALHCYSLPQI